MPQSTRRRLPAALTRYLDPVTVPAAPRKVSLGIGVSFYTARKPDSVGFHHRVRRGHRDKLGQEKIVWRFLVEPMGFEPTTSSMPSRRAPNCATAPPSCSAVNVSTGRSDSSTERTTRSRVQVGLFSI